MEKTNIFKVLWGVEMAAAFPVAPPYGSATVIRRQAGLMPCVNRGVGGFDASREKPRGYFFNSWKAPFQSGGGGLS
jgi:hypothetical protein